MDGARSCFFLAALLLSALSTFAQSEPGPARREADSPLLVLTNGQLLEYPFQTRSDGYEVELPGGLQFIESSRVLCVAATRRDAWRELRGTYQALTPDIHVQLARWCMKYELSDAAERELLDALHLDPNREDAQQLLQQITSQRLAKTPLTKDPSAVVRIPGAPGMAAPLELRSLGGLSAENARGFVRHVQPLLSNRCAAAGCHGPGSQSEFRFTSVRNGSNPLTAERNLAAVLNQVLTTDPPQSPLLLSADSIHGGMTEPAFRGRVGSQQRKLLQDWVTAAVKDLYPESAPPEPGTELQPALTALDDQNPGEIPVAADKANQEDVSAAELPHGSRADKSVSDRRFLQQAARSVANDPFSPEKFNRRFHLQGPQPSPEAANPEPGLYSTP
ncbi:MAG: hypothetical protein RLZZ458_3599 [Planctomycetota bacterium]